MKKTLSILLAIILVVLIFPLGSFELTTKAEGLYKYKIEQDGVIITEVSKDATGSIAVPSKLGQRDIVKIDDYAFYNCDSVTSITIPDSITSIGEVAFGFCDNLSSITLGNGINVISKGAFSDCVKLESIVLNDKITEIGDYAFANCTSLAGISLPNSVSKIGEAAFSYCSAINSISIGDNVNQIGDYAFGWCDKLRAVTLGSGIAVLNEGLFFNCVGLVDVALSSSVTTIEDYAFYSCDVKDIWYSGSQVDRENIVLGIENSTLEAANWHFDICEVKPTSTGVYNIKPSKTLNGFTKDSITVLDKNYKEVKYNETKKGWPLVEGQIYAIELSEEFGAVGDLSWKLTKKSTTIFPDTSSGEWYNNAVTYAVGAGIINGYGDGTFGPGNNIQRQDFLVILAKLEGVDLEAYGKKKSAFSDVPEGSYYEAAINWGAENNIVSGYANGKFGVGDNVTREQLVRFLYNYANYKGIDTSYKPSTKTEVKNKYKDYKYVSDWAQDCVLWAIEKGIISGTSDTTISPGGNALRCQVAQIMYNIYLKDIL